jgi:DNA polymerase-3 subunit alpha
VSEAGELRNGLPVRLSLARNGAQVELQLGESAKFFPTDAALASWTAQAEAGKAAVIYD